MKERVIFTGLKSGVEVPWRRRGGARRKLSPEDEREAMSLALCGLYQWQIADHFGVTQPTICRVLKRLQKQQGG